MAIARSSDTPQAKTFLVTSSFTYAQTLDSGGLLFIAIGLDTTTDLLSGASAVTYRGQNCTRIDALAFSVSSVYLYAINDPGVGDGTNNVVISPSSVRSGCVVSGGYTGASSTWPDSHNNSGTVSNAITESTTVVAASCWLVGAFFGQEQSAPTGWTAGAGTSVRAQITSGSVSVTVGLLDSNATVGTGSQSLVGNFDSTQALMSAIASFAPGAAAASTPFPPFPPPLNVLLRM